MKICIPIRPAPGGGGFYFIELFRRYLSAQGIPWTDDVSDEYDVLFTNAWHVPFRTIESVKRTRPNLRVVHRVDGAARDYGRTDGADRRQARVNLLADATIFQSDYCRWATRDKCKVIMGDGPVIPNAVDLTLFKPNGGRRPGANLVVANAAWSTNPRKGTYVVPRLAERFPEVTFVLCGRYEGLEPRENIRHMGALDHASLARTLAGCDAFLDLSMNECCPNVDIQALACGLPVIHRVSGGTPEIVGDAGVPLHDDLSNLGWAFDQLRESQQHLSAMARERAERLFSPGVVFLRYLEVLQNSRRRPIPSAWDVLKGSIRGYPVLPTALDLLRQT